MLSLFKTPFKLIKCSRINYYPFKFNCIYLYNRFYSTHGNDVEGGAKNSKNPLNTGDSTANFTNIDVNLNKIQGENTNSDDDIPPPPLKDDVGIVRFIPFGIYGGILLFGVGYSISYMNEKNYKLADFLDDISQRMNDCIEYIFPSDNTPLLPDVKELNYPPNLPTLVLDFDKVIAKMEYDRKYGWRVKKRPYADKFFKELVNYYEIVIWSDDSYPVATDVANRWGLPVIGCIHRDQCKKYKGSYIKDLNKLGRDLRRVILIDHDRVATMLQENNSILIPEFTGDENDMELYYLINLLKNIAMNPQDVTIQLKNLGGGNDYKLGQRYSKHLNTLQQRAQDRISLSKMFGFKHY